MLRGDRERRMNQEQGGGEEEQGAVLRAPQVPWDNRLLLAGRSRDLTGSRSSDALGAPGAACGALRCCQVLVDTGEHGCTRVPVVLHPHTASSILTAGQHGPGSLTSSSSQGLPAGCQPVSKATICQPPGSSSGQLEPEVFPKCL